MTIRQAMVLGAGALAVGTALPGAAVAAPPSTASPEQPITGPETGPGVVWDLGHRLAEGPRLPPGVPVEQVMPRRDRGGYVAKITRKTPVVTEPGATKRVWTAGPTTLHTGNATRLSVRAARFDAQGRPWLGVQLPIRPNEALGWVRYDGVTLEHTSWYVTVRLGTRRIEVRQAGRLRKTSSVVVGAQSTPTPVGQFAIYEIAKQGSPRDFLGPWALHLTAFSNVLTNYGGGPGRVAIHGRGPASILDAPLGAAGSHGCVRIPNSVVSWMHSRTRAGTPMLISQK